MQKNITLKAEEAVIQKAREKAVSEHTSLNSLFQQWLRQYIHSDEAEKKYQELMDSMSYAFPGRKFSREDMNER